LKQVQTVTVRTDPAEEMQEMQALIQRWAMNGWTVKNISQFSRSEGALGGLFFGSASSYSTIIFEKEDTSSYCTICNLTVNDMKLHRAMARPAAKPQPTTQAPKTASSFWYHLALNW
jgi:hypothetical protein